MKHSAAACSQKELYVTIVQTKARFNLSSACNLCVQSSSSSSSWWSLGLGDGIICASYLWVREWLCRPILDLQSRAQSGHWKFAVVSGIEAAKWRRSLADCGWWRRSSSSADDAHCLRVRQRCLSRAVATSSVSVVSI